MPDYSERFASTYLNAIGLHDLADKLGVDPYQGAVELTIAYVTEEEMRKPGKGKSPEPVVYWIDGTVKGMVLSRPNYFTIADLYGRNTDHWGGCRVALFLAPGEGGGGKDAIRVRRKRFQGPADVIPPSMVDVIRAKLNDRGLEMIQFVRWMAQHRPNVIKNLDSLELHEYTTELVTKHMADWIADVERREREKAEESQASAAEQAQQHEQNQREEEQLRDLEQSGGPQEFEPLGDDDIPF